MSSSNLSSTSKLERIRQLFDEDRLEEALQYIEKAGSPSPELRSALGVCLMRLGRTDRAVVVLRELVFGKLMCIPSDTPPLFQANYATSLLLKGHNQAAIDLVKTLNASDHPYIARLQQAIAQWRKSLPVHRRIACLMSLYPKVPVKLDFPPGEV
ncbi:MAG TPA: hypothetical protein P5279_13735 [Anaerohalosphaeraceae bacterium]|jgi:Flp pilus assembly protein TadD|nr:hypothetical protein [Anaerohalosphaeraceae bacterium]HRT51549.1 hypothetical protein [Anaerohalosphaeraceae bacterium]HRT87566.1 hypothetical protein [Anaerohalosphaeraceae bacterium]